jgi:putative intracellular protease/amidase/DNA-directed RNA polymerase subunit RPC12/RpoP
MKTLFIVAVSILVCLTLVTAADEKPKHYVCAPCGMECDKTVYEKPGTCPVCGARLMDQKAAEAAMANHPASKKVGILIFNGVEIIDYTGPWEVFGAADFDVYDVAETKDPVTTAMGMTVVPKYTFAEAPRPDILLVPGGDVHGPVGSAATLKWVAEQSPRTEHTLSVCNGAFILASAGLLDGLSATTTYHLLDKFTTDFPKVKVVRDQRFVDNGRIITAGGLSSGIDGALHVVSKVRGNGVAQEVALGLEYDWRPRSGFARGALALSLIPDLDLDTLGRWTVVSTEGGTDRWEVVARATTEMSAAELLDRLGRALADQGKWTGVKAAAAGPGSPLTSAWKFSGRDGKPWTGILAVQTVPGENGQYTARLNIVRAG